MTKLISTTPLPPTLHPPLLAIIPPNPLAYHPPTPHIHGEIAINISKLPPTHKKTDNMKIDDKVTFYYPSTPDNFSMITPRSSAK